MRRVHNTGGEQNKHSFSLKHAEEMKNLCTYIKWNYVIRRTHTRKFSFKHLLDTPSFEEGKAFTANSFTSKHKLLV